MVSATLISLPNHRGEVSHEHEVRDACRACLARPDGSRAAGEAADNGFYLGAGVSQAKTELSFDDFGSDDVDDTGFKIIGGCRPLDFLAVEANYMDLGGDSDAGT